MEKRILLILLIGLSFGVNAQNTFPSYGNVGIGTTNPKYKLHVVGDAISIEDSICNMYFIPKSSNYQNNTSSIIAKDRPLSFTTDIYRDIYFSTYYDNNGLDIKMTVKGNGNVGIGTTNPQSKLSVNGIITAKEIKVTVDGWSDFVLKKNYKLKTIEEVESFIKKNNHLPDVPSEKEVLNNGIEIGKMNAKLLQKIEELTIYMIEVNKKVKKLEKENVELKTKLNKLLISE